MCCVDLILSLFREETIIIVILLYYYLDPSKDEIIVGIPSFLVASSFLLAA